MLENIINYIQENWVKILIIILICYIVYRLIIFWRHRRVHRGGCKITNYYANWCGYSRAFLPVWKEFVVRCQEDYPGIMCDEVVCEEGNETICRNANISGYPTVVLENGHSKVIYEDARTVDGLLRFVRNNL